MRFRGQFLCFGKECVQVWRGVAVRARDGGGGGGLEDHAQGSRMVRGRRGH